MSAYLIGSFKSKTIWFGVMLMLANWLNNNISTIQGWVPEQYNDLILYAVGLIVWILRYFTKEPLEQKAKDVIKEF